ncbi:Urea transporter 2 [Armadillidium vulgare]|nr:Urea transporter 2 [Armadillidium vulgare]
MKTEELKRGQKFFKWFGNMSVMSHFINEMPWMSPWGIVKIFNSYFRALGVVAFANNPFTGILIFCGISYGNPHEALASFLCGIISVLTCKLIKAPNWDICEGICVFNSILVGCVLTSVLPPILGISLGARYWLILSFAAFITNFVEQGLTTMMAPSGLPVQSVPFNLIAAWVFLCYRTNLKGFELENVTNVSNVTNFPNDTSSYNETVDWGLVFQGTVNAIGQVYGVGNIPSSAFIWIGYFLYSPLLTSFFYIGSAIGAALAVFYNVQPLSDIYAGLWSFNSLLSAGGIIFFIVPTPMGMIASLVNAVIAVSVQAALTPVFLQTSIPVFSYPFNIAIMLILAISLRRESNLRFVENRTFPEEHFLKHYEIFGNIDFEEEEETGKPLRMIET